MRLERHVGGLGKARKEKYLFGRGWSQQDGAWVSTVPDSEPQTLNKALHHQLTHDLGKALEAHGWKIIGYSPSGYAQLTDPLGLKPCSLPAALRRQARREKRPVAELTYSLFLAAML